MQSTMSLPLKAIIVHVLLCFVPSSAKVASRVVKQNKNETHHVVAAQSWAEYLRPPSREELEKDMEARWNQLEEDIMLHKAKLQYHMNQFERDVKKTEKRLKRRIEKDVLKQRQGWQRFRNSVRDHIGLVLGGTMAFAGGGMERTAAAFQMCHLSWFALHKSNSTRGIYDPWLKDAVAGTVALSVISSISGTPFEQAVLQTALPLLTIAVALARSVGIMSDYFVDDVNPAIKTTLQVVVTGIGITSFYISPLPLPLVAASIAGATLMYESVITEVVGNWWYMLEHMSPEKKRSIRQAAYRKLQQQLLYPVRNAFVQIHAAIHNETLASPTLHQKVNDAIHNSFQVRLVWACAAVGVLSQVFLSRLIEKTANTVICTWWNGRTNKPR